MLIIDIVSWVIVGLVIGAVWAFLASDEHIKLVGTLIFGVIGALVVALYSSEKPFPASTALQHC